MKIIRNILKLIFVVLLIFFVIALFFVGKGYIMYKNALEEIPLKDMIFEIKNKRNYYSVASLPKIYKDAVLAVEDHRFYKHGGVDIISICRAVIKDIQAMSFVEGGSTITQQLTKNIYFTQEKKVERKVAEIFMAFNFEKNYSKDDILELYVNTSYFGDNCHTVKEASRHYFGKEPMKMTDYESIMLAGIPNAPSVYAPTINLKLAKERQRQVLNKMIEYKYLTEDEANSIIESE